MDSYTQGLQRQSPGGMEESASRMTAEAPAGGDASSGWKVDNVSVSKAENGGFIVHCSRTRERPEGNTTVNGGAVPAGREYESKQYAFGNAQEMLAYVAQEFGVSGEGGAGGAQAPIEDEGY